MIAEKVQELEQENAVLKAQLEEMQDIYGNRAELPKNCEYCSNFIQYYIRTASGYHPIYDGTCTAGNRTKGRKAKDTCKAFEKKEYGTNRI